MPTTNDQTIVSGQYLAGTQTIKGDENLVPENIAEGVSIFGVEGTLAAGSAEIPFHQNISYTGNANFIDDGDGNYRVKFLTSGTLTVQEDTYVDIFAVGGGGNGSAGRNETEAYLYASGSGGGGGYNGGATMSVVHTTAGKGGTGIVIIRNFRLATS